LEQDKQPEELRSQRPFVRRLGGYLHKIVPIADSTGQVVERLVVPIMVELRYRDVVQILVGACILALPVSYTEEAWNLGASLSVVRVVGIALLSIAFMATYVYYNFYRRFLRQYFFSFIRRVVTTYLISLLVVAGLLTLIDKCPWGSDNILAIKRIVIVAFPASMSAAVTDSLK